MKFLIFVEIILVKILSVVKKLKFLLGSVKIKKVKKNKVDVYKTQGF